MGKNKKEKYLTISTLQKRVKNGIRYLKTKDKKWFNKIDLSIFDINDVNVCVCGQVFGYFWEVVNASWDSEQDSKKMSETTASKRGFTIEDDLTEKDNQDAWDFLQKIWFIEIAKAKGL